MNFEDDIKHTKNVQIKKYAGVYTYIILKDDIVDKNIHIWAKHLSKYIYIYIYIYSSSFPHFNYNNILVSGHVFQLKLLQQNKLNWWIFT